jgi:cyclopropane-fatty-acyl-phospholipid synthase
MSFGVIFRIHWQALKLWLKGVPFHQPVPPDSKWQMNTQVNMLSGQVENLPGMPKGVLKLLSKLQAGQLALVTPSGQTLVFTGKNDGIAAEIQIHDWIVCKACLKSGDIGFAETFMSGHWDSPDIESLLRLFLINRQVIEKAIYGSWWGRLGYRIKHWLHKNSKEGSKKNIHAHYDIGNSFYSLWLDPSMTYSSAIFEHENMSLLDAQKTKYNKIISSTGVLPGERLLEIGCGWGGLMESAKTKNIDIDCLTISQEQAHYAKERAESLDASFESQSSIILKDYRDHDEQYDGIASIEMFEAVGQAYWPSYFEMVYRCLKPGKKACIQSIVIAEELFNKYQRSSDFIQQYVFPGGMLPTISLFKESAEKAGLVVETVYSFGSDYQKTLRMWHEKFNAALVEIKSQGFDDRFIHFGISI